MRVYRISGFPYGLRNNGGPAILDEREMRSCRNIDLDKIGLPNSRGGCTYLNEDYIESEENDANSIVQFKDEDGTRHLIATAGGKILKCAITDYTDVTNECTQTYLAAMRYSYCVATYQNTKALLVGTNNTDKPFYYDHSDDKCYLIDDAPTKAKSVVWFHNRLLFGNIETDSTRFSNKVIYSGDRTPLTINLDDNLFIGNAGDEIVAMIEVMDYVAVLKEFSLWRIAKRSLESIAYTPTSVEVTPFENINVTNAVGCKASNSVVVVDNLIYFQGSNGFYVWDVRGTSEDSVKRIDLKIDWDQRVDSRMNEIHAVYHERRSQIRVWVPETPENDDDNSTISVFYSIHPYLTDYRRRPYQPAWTRNVCKANCSCAGYDSDEKQVIFIGDFGGKISILDDGSKTDNDTSIMSFFITGETDCGTPQEKTFHVAAITGKTYPTSNVLVNQYIGFGKMCRSESIDLGSNETFLPFTLPYTFGQGAYRTEKIVLGGSESFTSFRFFINSVDDEFGISSILIWYDTTI